MTTERVDKIVKMVRNIMDSRPRTSNKSSLTDRFSVRGSVRIIKNYGTSRPPVVVVDDQNLVVTLGRRVMSRLISGATEGPYILRTTSPAIAVIRDTTGSPASAHVHVTPVPDSNEFRIEGWADAVMEWSIQYTGGSQTMLSIATAISSETGWTAEVIGSVDSSDAVLLLPVDEAFCLGTGSPGDYATIDGAPHARVLNALIGSSSAPSAADLMVDRIRFGTEGYSLDNPALGRDVLATDENQTCSLRASDLGNPEIDDTWLSTVASYPNTGTVAFTASLGSSLGNGLLISEAGLYTPSHMIARKNFGQILKSNLFSLDIVWSLIF